MNDSKYILLVEVPVKADSLEAVKALSAATLIPTLQEKGCEVFYQMVKKEAPTTLVFFEVFTSQQAFDQHQEASYTKAFFESIQDQLAGQPVRTLLQELATQPGTNYVSGNNHR